MFATLTRAMSRSGLTVITSGDPDYKMVLCTAKGCKDGYIVLRGSHDMVSANLFPCAICHGTGHVMRKVTNA